MTARMPRDAGALDLAGIVAAGRRVQRESADAHAGRAQRIAVAGGVTTDLLCCAIACAVAQQGIRPVLHQSPFGAYVQEVLDSGSGLHRFGPELVVLAPDWHEFANDLPIAGTEADVASWLDARVALFQRLWSVLNDTLGARIVQHALVPPPHRFCGPAERLAPAAPERLVRALNERLSVAASGQVGWVELDRLAAEIGLRNWAAERFYASAKLPFDPRFLPEYLAAFRGAWRAVNGRAKRALVLDLDNTLWGGVIGDDGVDGIVLGPGSAVGEAFAAWGRYLKELRARGVALAVCSRNDPALAAAAFAHPHSVLGIADFAAFECSWDDKVQGLGRVARALNLDVSALVLADDNPAECAMVQEFLPQVGVACLGADPSAFTALLERGHWFDMPRYTTEDLHRGDAFRARREAESQRPADGDLGTFLAKLEMRGRVWHATSADLARISQLEQKTNQFNLTGRRYTEAALAAFLEQPRAVVLAFRLIDRFGDHGLVSSLVALPDGDGLRIDSWVMSCRVFARTAEPFVLRRLLDIAHQAGFARLIGEYLPTPRNEVVAGLFARLGFCRVAGSDTLWERKVAPPQELGPEAWIEPDP